MNAKPVLDRPEDEQVPKEPPQAMLDPARRGLFRQKRMWARVAGYLNTWHTARDHLAGFTAATQANLILKLEYQFARRAL